MLPTTHLPWEEVKQEHHLQQIKASPGQIDSLMKQELETSRAEVAKLKQQLAQLKTETAKERKSIKEELKEQVAQALQEQLSAFTEQMTNMFAQMMIAQQNDKHSTKRPAIYMQDDSALETQSDERTNILKRRDNKLTPGKISANKATKRDKMWQTPDYLEQIASQTAWTENSTPTQGENLGRTSSNIRGNNEIMSESEDEDTARSGSGIESINKS